jgi:hypothetical protein
MNNDVIKQLEAVRVTGLAVCSAVQTEIDKLGFDQEIEGPLLDEADYLLSRDPMNGKNTLVGTWRNKKGQKCGEILFHADGTFYAEYDVVRTHPKKNQWFVEGIEAWGNKSIVKAEPKLIPAVG